jgi:phosphopantothenoylcysteine synthetase/decarboxylase
MKCIVTAGPTYEELDEVRRLTNFSTGTLGSELANYLTEQGHEVELLLGHYSTCRIEQKARRTQVFTTTTDLRQRLQALGSRSAQAVFHAAAVSDFGFGRVWRKTTGGKMVEIKSPKISTRGLPVMVELLPTPKIIAELREWFPNAWLTGWKYELAGQRKDVIVQAVRQMTECKTNACDINGRAYGAGFGLVTDDGKSKHMSARLALFKALETMVVSHFKRFDAAQPKSKRHPAN